MFFLTPFPPMQPEFGLIFWTVLIFLLVWVFIGRLGFKPIAKALREREQSIDDALHAADKARQEMANLKAENEELLRQAREERAQILKEAKDIKDKIIAEAKERADAEFKRKVESAVGEIKNREMEMLTNVKNEVGKMALDIATKVIRKELSNSKEHEDFATKLVNEIKLN